ncbi:MAG: bifunctional phosphoribosylaminoimidazolecarboxamide formyltransferase/inosine monophosphate cyclohydrolase, partial [Chloroflexi bacterium RBG_16_57_9]
MKRVLLSVYDKSNLLDFARGLVDAGVELVASGGTARALAQAGLAVRSVEEVTGSPEILGGRVKTLHPAIHGGILAPHTPAALAEIAQHGIRPIDLVVCNLYPFSETIARPGVTLEEAIEQIDIGGVTLLRAAGKNHAYVTVVVDPTDYDTVLEELRATGETQPATRARLALKAFHHTARYDAAISDYLATQAGDGAAFPATLNIALEKVSDLRYGENPHQRGAIYRLGGVSGLAGARQLHGKEMSYTNWLDVDAAWMAANTFDTPTAIIIKHTNPCGAATAATLAQAYAEALECDPVSAYGGVVGLNRTVDQATAQAIAEIFTEAIIAPGFELDALAILQAKKNLRLFELPAWSPTLLEYRGVDGGMLVQERDIDTADPELKVVSER